MWHLALLGFPLALDTWTWQQCVASCLVWLAFFFGPAILFYILYRNDIALRALWLPFRHILLRRNIVFAPFKIGETAVAPVPALRKNLTAVTEAEGRLMGETIFAQAVLPLLILSAVGPLTYTFLSKTWSATRWQAACAISAVVVYRAVRLEKFYAISCPDPMRSLFNVYYSQNWLDELKEKLNGRGIDMTAVAWVKDADENDVGLDCLEGGDLTKAQFPLQVVHYVHDVRDNEVESLYDVIAYDFRNSTAAVSVTKAALASTVFNACSIMAVMAASSDGMRDIAKKTWGSDNIWFVRSVLAPGVVVFGLPGLMVTNLLSAILATLLVAAKASRSATQVRASISGFGIVSSRMKAATQNRISTSEVFIAFFDAIEAFASNFFKTSALMGSGFKTSSYGMLCLSIGFSLLLGAYSSVQTLSGGLKSDDHRIQRLTYLTVACYLLTAATTCRRLYIVFFCEDHAGGILGGCVGIEP